MRIVSFASCTQLFISICACYKPLSNDFLSFVWSGLHNDSRLDIDTLSATAAPLFRPRVIGSKGHRDAQTYIASFFRDNLPNWLPRWQNSTVSTSNGRGLNIANLIMSREPPWTRPGQSNFLTIVAHYDGRPMSSAACDGGISSLLLLCEYISMYHLFLIVDVRLNRSCECRRPLHFPNVQRDAGTRRRRDPTNGYGNTIDLLGWQV